MVKDITELYKRADYITIHSHFTDKTKGMINAESIAKMKDGVRVLNYSRDTVVDEDAILAAVESGKVAYFASDFPTYRNIGHPNVILTPHCGSNTHQARYEMAKQASLRIQTVLAGGLPENLLNPEALKG